jgi:hypothetical protein
VKGVWSPKIEWIKQVVGRAFNPPGNLWPNGRELNYECRDKRDSLGGSWREDTITCDYAAGLKKPNDEALCHGTDAEFQMSAGENGTRRLNSAVSGFAGAITHCCACGGGASTLLQEHLVPLKAYREDVPELKIHLNEFVAPSLFAYWQDVNEAVDRIREGAHDEKRIFEGLASLQPFDTQVWQDQVDHIISHANGLATDDWSKGGGQLTESDGWEIPAKLNIPLKSFTDLLDHNYVEQFVWTSKFDEHLDALLNQMSVGHGEKNLCLELQNSESRPRPNMLVTFEAFREYSACRKLFASKTGNDGDVSQLERETSSHSLPGPIVERYYGRWTRKGKEFWAEVYTGVLRKIHQRDGTVSGEQLAFWRQLRDQLDRYDLTYKKMSACKDLMSGGPTLRNIEVWKDDTGEANTCETYEKNNWCDVKGNLIEGFPYDAYTQGSWNLARMSAEKACCACGGGGDAASLRTGALKAQNDDDTYIQLWSGTAQQGMCEVRDKAKNFGGQLPNSGSGTSWIHEGNYLRFNELDGPPATHEGCKQMCMDTDGCSAIAYGSPDVGGGKPAQCFIFSSCDHMKPNAPSSNFNTWTLTKIEQKVTARQWDGFMQMISWLRTKPDYRAWLENVLANATNSTDGLLTPPLLGKWIDVGMIEQAEWWSSEVFHTFQKRQILVDKHQYYLPEEKVNQVYQDKEACTDTEVKLDDGESLSEPFEDADHNDCKWYLEQGHCQGDKVPESEGTPVEWYWRGKTISDLTFFDALARHDRVTAAQACCVCGGTGTEVGASYITQMEVHEKLADGSDMLQDLDEYLEYLNTASNSYDCGLKNPQLCKDEMKRLDFYLLDAVVEQEPAMLTDVGKEVLLRGVLDAKYNRSQKDPETTLIDEIFELGFLEEANFDSQVFAEQKQAWEEQCDDHSGLERDGETYAAKCQKAADFCAAGKPTAAFFNHPQVDAHVDDQINVGKDTIDMWRGCCLCGGGQHQAKWRFTAAADIGGMVGNVVKVERQDIYPQAPNFLWVLLWKVGHEDETPGLFFCEAPRPH